MDLRLHLTAKHGPASREPIRPTYLVLPDILDRMKVPRRAANTRGVTQGGKSLSTPDSNTPLLKVCTKCGQAKPADLSSYYAHHRGGPLRNECRECSCQKTKHWYATNPERARENARHWREENLDQKRENNRMWAQKNPDKDKASKDKWAAANPDKILDRVRRWRAAHPEESRDQYRRRRARKLGAEGFHTVAEVEQLREDQNDRCCYCGDVLNGGGHLDHKIPLVRGGSEWISNLAWACVSCNVRKSTRTDQEWEADRCK